MTSARDDNDVDECRDWCYLHGVEPLTERTYRVCAECGHAFEAQELLDAHNELARDLWERASPTGHPAFDLRDPDGPAYLGDPDDVRVCPLCTHDF